MPESRALKMVKLLHTAVWAIMVACILAIPFLGWTEQFGYASLLTGIVLLEIFVLVVNGWRCPLTKLAERYTDNRSENFDIYLPLWIARHNKLIFGALFLAGEIVVLLHWLR